MTFTVPMTLLAVAFLLTIIHIVTGGKVPLWTGVLLIILSLASPGRGEDVPSLTNAYVGKVLSVHDGDTINVEITLGFDLHMSPVAIRMVTVFAPELGKPGGAEATAKLKELLPVGAPIIVRPLMTANAQPNHEIMTFQRYVARIWRKDLDICEEMNRWLAPKEEIRKP